MLFRGRGKNLTFMFEINAPHRGLKEIKIIKRLQSMLITQAKLAMEMQICFSTDRKSEGERRRRRVEK